MKRGVDKLLKKVDKMERCERQKKEDKEKEKNKKRISTKNKKMWKKGDKFIHRQLKNGEKSDIIGI